MGRKRLSLASRIPAAFACPSTIRDPRQLGQSSFVEIFIVVQARSWTVSYSSTPRIRMRATGRLAIISTRPSTRPAAPGASDNGSNDLFTTVVVVVV
jgi:hypothetical protein